MPTVWEYTLYICLRRKYTTSVNIPAFHLPTASFCLIVTKDTDLEKDNHHCSLAHVSWPFWPLPSNEEPTTLLKGCEPNREAPGPNWKGLSINLWKSTTLQDNQEV